MSQQTTFIADQNKSNNSDAQSQSALPTELSTEHDDRQRGRNEARDFFPLTSSQREIWFDQLRYGDAPLYNIGGYEHIAGNIDPQRFERAVNLLIQKHDILRMVLIEGMDVDGLPMQRFSEQISMHVALHDFSHLADPHASAMEWMQKRFEEPFVLYGKELFRYDLLKINGTCFYWLAQYHHIILDGWAIALLCRSLGDIYTALEANEAPDLNAPSYRDFISDDRAYVDSALFQRQRKYWQEKYQTLPDPLLSPNYRSRFSNQSVPGESHGVHLPRPLYNRLIAVAKANNATTFHTILGALYIYFARTAHNEEMMMGLPVLNRSNAAFKETAGLFVGVSAVRFDFGTNLSFRELIRAIGKVLKQDYRHQRFPVSEVGRAVGLDRQIFDVSVSYARHDHDTLYGQAWARSIPLINSFQQTPLTLFVWEFHDDEDVLLHFAYNLAYFERSEIEAMQRRLVNILGFVLDDMSTPVNAIPLLTDAEEEQIKQWNQMQAHYPQDRCIHQLFEAQAEKTPDAVAVMYKGGQLTYAELNARANRLAHHLLGLGVVPDALVAICVERSLEMVVGLLAILKAGGAYVPLDPAYPVERLAYMLEDSAPVVVVTQAALVNSLPALTVPVAMLDNATEAFVIAAQSDRDPDLAALGLHARHMAYVIYTSGSTGQPKGVMVEHANVTRLFAATDDWFHFNRNDVWTLFHSFAFDFSVWELWGALLHGGRLVVVPHLTTRSPQEFYQLLGKEGVTVLNQTPSAFRQLVAAQGDSDAPHRLRCVIFGGEALDVVSLKPWCLDPRNRDTRLVNMYGITETAVHVTYRVLEPGDADRIGSSQIGCRIPDLRLYILDAQRQPVPIGVAGEMYVGGAGVARGYLNRPELTAERFVTDPFSSQPDARMYKAGDLARYLPDGNIEFLGRNDFQVKIRGFRIELGEIETRLAQHPGVREAVVLAREDSPGDKRLVAYYTVKTEAGEFGAEALRTHLRETLPDYMTPAAYVELKTLPLTPNGKLDRKALPAPGKEAYAARSYEAPVGEIEMALAAVWADMLKVELIGRHDNFFELGGHSLLAVQLASRLRRDLGVEITLRDLFAHPTLHDLAHVMAVSGQTALTAIPHADRSGPLPLSWSQQRLWFLDQLDPVAGAAYHMPAALRLHGVLDCGALQAALDRIVARHEILRTTFAWVAGQAQQAIAAADIGFMLIERDLSHLHGEAQHNTVLQLAAEEAATRFDLSAGPPIRGRLLLLSGQEHILLITQHHIVSDGWSIGILIKEISALYSAFIQGMADPLPPLAIQYADYAAWQRGVLPGEKLQIQLDYWKAQLGGAPVLLELPADRPRPQAQSYRGGQVLLALSSELTDGLRQMSRRHGATLFMSLLAGWSALLSRLSGQQDVVIGTLHANRQRSELESMIGFFVNTLALRVGLEDNPSVVDLLAQVKADTMAAYSHQDVLFEQVVEALQPPRSLGHNPVFQAMLALNNTPDGGALTLPGLTLSALEQRGGTAANYELDVYLSLNETGTTVTGSFLYASDLFDQATAERMMDQFQRLLAGMVADDRQRIGDLPLLSEAERKRVLVDFNDTAVDYPPDQLIHQLFEAQVEKTPNAIAVVHEDRQLTYAELNAWANRLAHHLQGLGVVPDARAAICVERSLDMVVGLLAILKAGGAYVPLDPTYPVERLIYMLEDSAPVVLLTHAQIDASVQARLRTALPAWGDVAVVDFSADADRWARRASTNLDRTKVALTPDHLAYVIYTSGSTGQPKGVMVEHRGVVNRLLWMQDAYRLNSQDAVLQKTPFSFDVSVWEFFWPLLAGARLVMARVDGHKNPAYLTDVIREQRISTLHFVPSMLQVFLEHGDAATCSSLVRVMCSGEALPGSAATRFRQRLPHAALHNLYGPTEASVDVTAWACTGDVLPDNIPIGRPIANTQIYLLDAHGQPTPIGVVGEMYIGGVQVARGYLNRLELTAERFVKDPFSNRSDARIYKTGDQARYLPDGNIEFLGRNDHQVKIRGYRIELGEIEARLAQHPGVREAVVLAREDSPGDKRLMAYYTATQGLAETADEINAEAMRAHLLATLPEHMVPAAYVKLEALPLTPNGKLDRKALPAPGQDAYSVRSYEAPVGEIEVALAGIWADVLKLERIGRHDNFFDLGGHSLLAVSVLSRLRQSLHVEVGLIELFAHPQLSALAQVIETAGRSALPPILPTSRETAPPLSFAQQRLWFLSQMEGISQAYHLPAALRLTGKLDRMALRRALDRVMARHEALRTTFVLQDGEPAQRIAPADSGFALQEIDLRGHANAENELRRLAVEEAAAAFPLDTGPLIRGRLVWMHESEHVLLVTMHHIVSDGWSIGVLTGELSALYTAYCKGEDDPLPPLAIQYADYAAWQRNWLTGEVLQAQTVYWQRTLAGAPALLELPTDRLRPTVQDHAGAAVRIELDPDLTAGLKAFSQQHGTTLYMTLLTAWGIVLARLSGQHDIVIGSPVANRTRAEVEPLIGFFVNTLVLRLDLSGNPTATEALRRVKERALDAQQHQDLPFEQVVGIMRPARSLAHSPLFQVMFAWQNNAAGSLDMPGLTLAPVEASYDIAKFDLTLSLAEAGERIVGGLEYSTALFDPATIARYLGYLRNVLKALVTDDCQAIEQLPLLGSFERQQLLADWNATQVDYPQDRCIHTLFEAQVEKTPNAVAVVHEDKQLTYTKLNVLANRLGHYLQDLGVTPDTRVAICVERGINMMIGLLAILKAGGAYVPLDPGYPVERLTYMLKDSGPVVLLTDTQVDASVQAQLRAVLPALGEVALIDLEADAHCWVMRSGANPDTQAALTPDHLAYVIYTSGSTGQPKGVMVEHRGVVNRLLWMQDAYRLDAQDAVLQKTPFSFDVSVWEFFWPLLAGAKLVMARVDGHKNPAYLADVIREQRISTLHFVPSMLQAFLDHGDAAACSCLVRVMCSGEALPGSAARRFRERLPHVALHNLYGPTEASIDVTAWTCSDDILPDNIPIGRPIANTQIYLLDARGQPTPVGVAGELHIGGVQVARGYLNRAELTVERFMDDPFSDKQGARLYKTGDLARWLPDGNIEFLGRNDSQIKIRGFRIELGEIEARLAQHPAIREAVVLAREDQPGDKRLVAYYKVKPEAEEVGAEALRTHLLETLPDYMAPTAYVMLEALPLTPNGKLDRKALPAPEQEAHATRGYEAPTGMLEIALADVLTAVLKLERTGRHDNFFELGGHSLLAIKVVHLLQQMGINITVIDLFNHPTAKSLANYLTHEKPDGVVDGVLPVRIKGTQRPLFLVHEGHGLALYFPVLASRVDPDIPVYGLPGVPLGEPQLQTMEELAARMVRLICEVQPSGPYRVAGWSYGGVVAYEIAAQLIKQGHLVEFVGLLDSYAPVLPRVNNVRQLDRDLPQAYILAACKTKVGTDERRRADFDALQHVAPGMSFEELFCKCSGLGVLPYYVEDRSAAEAQQYVARVIAHNHAAEYYVPQPIDVRIDIFIAQDQPDISGRDESPPDSLHGWGAVLPEHLIRVHDVPGDHQSMMSTHIAVLGQALTDAIASSDLCLSEVS